MRIVDELVDGIDDGLEAAAIGEALEERAQFAGGLLERVVGSELLVRVLGMIGDGASMRSVLLQEIEEPTDRLLVVLVLLALDDDLEKALGRTNEDYRDTYLLATVDELVTALFREVFLTQETLSAVNLILSILLLVICAIFVLLGNTVEEVVLDNE